MPEILPNWHPLFVHFTIGLLLTAVVFFVLSHLTKEKKKSEQITIAAKWMLWTGAGFAAVTVATGLYAFATVGHDEPAHLAMKDHRLWAIITAGAFISLAVFSLLKHRKGHPLPGLFTPFLIICAALLVITGYKGGELVYRHGLGVLSLPEAEGESHNHDHGGGNDETAAKSLEKMADFSNFDLSTPTGTVNAFNAALKAGDAGTARGLLDDNVLIYESGYVERSAEEYAGHHMPADMEFVSALTSEILSQAETVSGDMATVVTETRTQGTYKDKDYDLTGTGTMVLKREGDGWKIIHIHWSSHESK